MKRVVKIINELHSGHFRNDHCMIYIKRAFTINMIIYRNILLVMDNNDIIYYYCFGQLGTLLV